VVPGNDDAIKSIRLFTAAIADAVNEGRSASTGRSSQTAAYVGAEDDVEEGVQVVKRYTAEADEDAEAM
jgi:ribosomal protein S2